MSDPSWKECALRDLAAANGIRQGINAVHRGEKYEEEARRHADSITLEALKMLRNRQEPDPT